MLKSMILVFGGVALMATVALAQPGRSKGTAERFDADEITTVAGTVIEVDRPFATLKGENGKEYKIHLGPVWFWDRRDYTLKKGMKAEVRGEVENVAGSLHLYPWEIKQDGNVMTLADEDGVPEWAGGRSGQGQSYYSRGKGFGGMHRAYHHYDCCWGRW